MNPSNDLQEILSQALAEMKRMHGEDFNLKDVNLAELQRMTGISRSRLRTLKRNGFLVLPHGNKGKLRRHTVLEGYEEVLNTFLSKGVTNSQVCYERISDLGYTGGLTAVKVYIKQHCDLVPAKRSIVAPQGSRGIRYQTAPGEAFQMDWGFANVDTESGGTYSVACFAMICHHCGMKYIEFFPNAKQENLFIGMLHAFERMGIPKYVLTDNMKSVVTGRDENQHPLWNTTYAVFMKAVGFQTKLCKPRHPFTKGSVERLVRFVKDNFLAGRAFGTITDLNYEALRWCDYQNNRYQKAIDSIPAEIHQHYCVKFEKEYIRTPDLMAFLCPERRISFDGFVNYEGRRFGVPSWYTKRTVRVLREQFYLVIYSSDLSRELVRHNVTWSRRDSYCKDQYVTEQPEEHPTDRIKVNIKQKSSLMRDPVFGRFNFEEGLW